MEKTTEFDIALAIEEVKHAIRFDYRKLVQLARKYLDYVKQKFTENSNASLD